MAKLSEEQIIEILKEKGFKAIDVSGYKNLNSDIMIECEHGHLIQTNLGTARKKNFRCPKCEGGTVKVHGSKYPPKKDGYRVIGIDNATEKFGVSIFDDGELVFSTVLEFKGLLDDRLVTIRDVMEQVIIPEWQPDFIMFEDIQYQNNYKTYKILAMLLGVLRVAARKHSIEFGVVSPATWRGEFNITGKNRAIKKQNAIKRVKEMYDLALTDDEAEAILIGKYASNKKNKRTYKTLF